jgi:hypothetical protein
MNPKIIAAALVLAAAGCYGGSGADSPASKPTPPSSGVPPGVIPSGLYESVPSDQANCCWLAGSARLPVHLTAGVTHMRITLALPAFSSYTPPPQTVAVSVDGVLRGTYPHLDPGMHTVEVPLAPVAVSHDAVVRLDMAYTFVPKDEHISEDSRRISMQLKSVIVR